VKCPAGRNPANLCLLHVYTGEANACQACVDDWRERAAILEYGALKPGTTDPLCRSRAEVEGLATKMLVDKLKILGE
jgi:hypothetical protein